MYREGKKSVQAREIPESFLEEATALALKLDNWIGKNRA